MTATGNEAVSLAQLKDYAANQSAGGGSGYTYKYLALVYTATYGNWTLGRVSDSGYANPRISVYYNENELTIESVLIKSKWSRWGVTVSSKSGKVHFLGASIESQEIYPMRVAAPYIRTDAHQVGTGVLPLGITKQGNVLTVSNLSTLDYEVAAYPKLKFYITED